MNRDIRGVSHRDEHLSKILLATDGSEEANLALQTATDLAKGTGPELHFVYVEAAPYVLPTTDWESLGGDLLPTRLDEVAQELAKINVDEQVQKVREAGSEIAGSHARVGYPEAEIVDLAEELGAGLIVMGSRGLGGLRRTLMGSVSDSVARHAHCPVLVTRHMPMGAESRGEHREGDEPWARGGEWSWSRC